jgi:hypothetical protein
MYGFLWGQLKTRAYATPDDNKKALHCTVDACQTICNCPGIPERVRRSMIRRVEACIEIHGEYFNNYYK